MSSLQARAATADERRRWDELVAANPAGGDFVLAEAFAETKAAVGWTPRHLVFARGAEIVSVALVLERRIPTVGTYWYLPHGPAVTTPRETHEHAEALAAFAKAGAPRVFAITIEPPIENTHAAREALETGPYSLSGMDARWREGLQGNTSTAIVNIDRDDDALMTSFHKKCRNMIRRAERDGVRIVDMPATPETFAHMHRLMRLVGGGNKQDLNLRSEDYAERFWRGFSARGQGSFAAIEVDGTPAVMAYSIRIGDRAFYKDGGSERPRVTPGMSNLMQWHLMRQARDAGAKTYDMLGVPPRDQLDDPAHPNHSLAPFKLSFAREVTEYIGAYDLVLRPAAFRRWQRYGLPVAQRLHRKRYHDLGLF